MSTQEKPPAQWAIDAALRLADSILEYDFKYSQGLKKEVATADIYYTARKIEAASPVAELLAGLQLLDRVWFLSKERKSGECDEIRNHLNALIAKHSAK